MSKKHILYLIFLIVSISVPAQANVLSSNITVKDGLAHYSVQCIAQDKYGFIWLGTLNGLTRYDGYNLKTYQASPIDSTSISNNRIQLIYMDENQDMWVSTFDSIICKYNYQQDNFIRYKKEDVAKKIQESTDRLIDKSRQYASSGNREFLIHENKYLVFRDKSTGKSIPVREILPNSISKMDFNCVFIDKSNVLWIGTNYHGVLKVDLTVRQFKPVEVFINDTGSAKAAIRCILEDNGKLWLGTFEDGLIVTATPYTQNNANQKIRSLYKDHLGNIWVGCYTGVDCIDFNTGKLNAMSMRGKVTGYDKTLWSSLQELPNHNYQCIVEDKSNTLWLASLNGIFRHDRTSNTFQYIDLSQYAKHSLVTCILSDTTNNLWVATEGGGIVRLTENASSKEWEVSSYYHFENGNSNSLPDDRIYSIQEDASGYIWIGTPNGLCRIHPTSKSVTTYNQEDGISDSGIACLLLDKHQQLWVSHKKGISRIDTRSLSIENYTIPVIDEGAHFLSGSGYYNEVKDFLYFGYTEGYIHFSPLDIQDNSIRPLPRLVNLRIDNQSVGVNQLINNRIILNKPLHATSEISLTYKERSISIEFTGIHFAHPELNRFEYMLEGYDTDWIVSHADNRRATYSNLSPGSYIFKVKAANANDLWSTDTARLFINVQTPWWATWLAYVIYFALAAGLLYLFISILLSKQKVEHQLHVERLKADQMEEIESIRTNFFTNISHELRTPLTLILDPINRMVIQSNDPQEHLRHDVIKRNAERLLTLVNDLLDVRKAEEGRLALNLQVVDLYLLIEDVRRAFLFNAAYKSISINLISEFKSLPAKIDRKRMETVLYNLLSNAVKNAKDEKRPITITLNLKNETSQQGYPHIELSIRNHSETIAPSELEKIFYPFYQTSTNTKAGTIGTGLGLTITRQIVELHNGTISVSSENGLTTFTILIPYIIPEKELTNQNYETSSVHQNLHNRAPQPLLSIEQMETFDKELPLVLIIEDNSDIRQYIKSELGIKFKFLEAPDGKIGVDMAKTYIPDLIITDVMMPGLNGFEVCTEVKNDMRTCHIPIIILTARQSEESHIEGYETGADSYITKPFSIQRLESRIINLLSNRRKLITFLGNTNNTVIKDVAPTAESDFLNELKQQIMDSDKMFSVEGLAERMCMSRSQLYRKIRTITNRSASDFINKTRMDYACQLLMEGEYNVSEIALKLGYSEQANFSRSFYRHYGKYPTQYLLDLE